MATTLPSGFENLDDLKVYERCLDGILHAETQNLVIQFDDHSACAALDVKNASFESILQTKRTKSTSTRWINIWAPEQQADIVQTIGKHYQFSTRLQAIMCSKPPTPDPPPASPQRDGFRHRYITSHIHRKSVETQSSDLEMNENEVPHKVHSPAHGLSYWRLVDEVWHYVSVDWGTKYLCIGYNSLSDTAAAEVRLDNEMSDDSGSSHAGLNDTGKPNAVRVWTWLVLCDDDTVICINENPRNHMDPSRGHHNTIEVVRRNIINVFKQLSSVSNEHRKMNPLDTLDIRPGLSSNLSSNVSIADSPGLLFYYIFDDWYSSYALVAKKEYQYSKQLENLRQQMFVDANPERVQSLHNTGLQLSVLKKVYQSYALIIDRILDKQKEVATSPAALPVHGDQGRTVVRQQTNPAAALTDETLSEESQNTFESQTLGPPLTSAAIVRFERLRDRINHFALSEIQECLDQKEQLVFLNFNLITMRQSQAVEKLTRITILLAKVTILFMPVSLMTAYFSTQIPDLQSIYTAKTYWVSFIVIMTLSFLFLFVFGRFSGTLEGGPIYRSAGRALIDLLLAPWRMNKRKKK